VQGTTSEHGHSPAARKPGPAATKGPLFAIARGRCPSPKRPSAANSRSRTTQRSRFGSPSPKHAERIGAPHYGIATLQIWYVIAAIVGGYALAVGSHYGFKDGKPLVGRGAVMGARADFRMIGLALAGRLDDEFRKYGIARKENSGK
jgi:hypothetical protein